MEGKKLALEYLRRSQKQIIECQAVAGRIRLESADAESEIGLAIETFKQKALEAIEAGRPRDLGRAADEMDSQMVDIARRYAGREYTFEVDSTRQWRHVIMLGMLEFPGQE